MSVGCTNVGVSLKHDLVKRLDAIVDDGRSIFTNRSHLIAHCIIQHLPDVERELSEAKKR